MDPKTTAVAKGAQHCNQRSRKPARTLLNLSLAFTRRSRIRYQSCLGPISAQRPGLTKGHQGPPRSSHQALCATGRFAVAGRSQAIPKLPPRPAAGRQFTLPASLACLGERLFRSRPSGQPNPASAYLSDAWSFTVKEGCQAVGSCASCTKTTDDQDEGGAWLALFRREASSILAEIKTPHPTPAAAPPVAIRTLFPGSPEPSEVKTQPLLLPHHGPRKGNPRR